jgi:hypothetical protein
MKAVWSATRTAVRSSPKMADVEVDIDQVKLEQAVSRTLETFMTAFIRQVVTTAQGTTAPVRSGRLSRAIEGDPVRRVGPFQVASGVSVKVPYAAAVHEGARPHVIRPRFARALRFEVQGRTVFASKVNHPGNRPNPFLRNAVHRVASADPRITFGGQ